MVYNKAIMISRDSYKNNSYKKTVGSCNHRKG